MRRMQCSPTSTYMLMIVHGKAFYVLDFVLLEQQAEAAGHWGRPAHVCAHVSCVSVLRQLPVRLFLLLLRPSDDPTQG